MRLGASLYNSRMSAARLIIVSSLFSAVAGGCRRLQQLPTTAELPAAVCTTPETVAVASTLGGLEYLFFANFALILVGAIVARVINLKLGITIAAIAAVGVALAAACILYFKWIALVGFVVVVTSIVASVGLLGWYLWKHRKRVV